MMKSVTLSFCLVSVGSLLANAGAHATTPDDVDPNLPQHEAVCVNAMVSKRQLAAVLLIDTKNYDAVLAVSRGPDLWRTIFTDDNFCKIPPSCANNPNADICKAAAKCSLSKSVAVQAAVSFFTSLNSEVKKAKPSYTESRGLTALAQGNVGDQVSLYFADSRDSVNPIGCTATAVPTAAPPYDPTKDPILSKVRVRGLSDDLYVDRSLPAFKGTSSATGTITGDTNAAHTYSTKVTGAFGYAFDSLPQTQIVPYVSLFQSLTDTALKPRVFDPNDNVAGGVLAQRYFDYGGVSHVFTVKPQYLLYTSNQAELFSVRAIYAPWMDIPFNINTFRRLDFLPGTPWGQITFNLRSDTGNYTNRGNTPALAALNKDFERAGAQVGFTLTTDGVPNVPSLTLIVAETYLYGFSGFFRHMDLFQSSLTYNFANSYVGLTASYKHGRDEDTAVTSQAWMIGLSGHY